MSAALLYEASGTVQTQAYKIAATGASKSR
jgi:hypothetical protein